MIEILIEEEGRKIKKLLIVISMLAVMSLFFVGCLQQKLVMNPEKQRMSSVSDTANCKFIKTMTFQTMPRNMIHYLTLNTYDAGGDTYKIINTRRKSLLPGKEILIVNFEVYKCK